MNSEKVSIEIAKVLLECEIATGFPAKVGLAKAVLETGWFKAASGANNYFGITANAEDLLVGNATLLCWTVELLRPEDLKHLTPIEGKSVTIISQGTNGKNWYRIKRLFRSFSSIRSGVEHYIHLMVNKPGYSKLVDTYRVSRRTHADLERLVMGIAASGYSTQSRASAELKLLRNKNLDKILKEAKCQTW